MAPGRGPGRSAARSGDERVRRSRLLFASAEPARLRQGNRSARRAISKRGSRLACAPRHWPIPPPRSRRSRLAAGPHRSMATSPAFCRGSSPSKIRSRGARAELAGIARALAPSDRGGDFAQALMDITARPYAALAIPLASSCPLAPDCAAFRAGTPETRTPRRAEARARPRRQGAVFSPAVSTAPFSLAAVRRTAFSLRPLSSPGTPWNSKAPPGRRLSFAPIAAHWRRLPGTVEQVFTHFALTSPSPVYAAEFDGGSPRPAVLGRPLDAVGAVGFSSMMREGGQSTLSRKRDARRSIVPWKGQVVAANLGESAARRTLNLTRKTSASPWRP